LAKEFNACESFLKDLSNIHSARYFKHFLYREMESICDKLNIDGFNRDLESDIEDLEDKISELENENEELQQEIEDLKTKYGLQENTLIEEYKTQYFCEYKNNYTAWEIEELLKNGKIFLNRQFLKL
jgi:septal ring factor EnvC (AmiA/AmiB activator)